MRTSLKRLASRADGGVAASVGIVFVAITAAVGAAIDFTHAYNRRADLQHAVDAAALAGAANPQMSIADIEAMANANARQNGFLGDSTVTVTREGTVVRVAATGESPTWLLGMIGFDGLTVNVEGGADYVPGSPGGLEVAIVLDVTESMADDMGALRSAARRLVDQLYAATGGENLRISIVPYAGAVNVGNGTEQLGWVDVAGTAPYHARNSELRHVASCKPAPAPTTPPPPPSTAPTPPPSTPSCNAACGCPGEVACGGEEDDGAFLDLPTLLGAGTAKAGGTNPYPEPSPATCPTQVPAQVSHMDLFDSIPNADWAGCVEARPEPYDVSDAAPDPSDPASMFVPYFWPDESDVVGDNPAYDHWVNDYMDDWAGGPTIDDTVSNRSGSTYNLWANIWKYDGSEMGTIVENTPNMKGPNRGCPQPILPLTSERATVDAKINALQHRVGGGTVISEGLAWGWRTLTPGAPFTQGAASDDGARKIVVLMSDGANQVRARTWEDGMPTTSLGDYTAYGFGYEFLTDPWGSRDLIDEDANSGTPVFDQIEDYLNARTLAACDNVKASGGSHKTEIYTVLVGDASWRTAELMKACATTPNNHYKRATQISSLEATFEEVAAGISGYAMSRLVE